jgi:hypothetical protein
MTDFAPAPITPSSVKEAPPDPILSTDRYLDRDREHERKARSRKSAPPIRSPLHPSTHAADRRPSVPPSPTDSQTTVGRQPHPWTTVGEDFHTLAHTARGKTSDLLSRLGVRQRNSHHSLRSPAPPRPSAVQEKKPSVSSVSSNSEEAADHDPSRIAPDRPSSSSSASLDEVTPPKPLPAANVERPSLDTRSRSVRPSVDVHRPSEAVNPRTSSTTPASAAAVAAAQNKMHQTSSRLLRMTDEERPFTRDFMDLFATLMVSLPLNAHRVRFTKIDHTFTSEEAINNLGSLKFSQSNRMPDPKDPSRIVTTTTTTTFSMAKEMARSVCQRFMDARFIEPADGKTGGIFPLKSALWQLTPKGMHLLQRFCQRNGINSRHIIDVLESPRNTMQLVILERDPSTDKVSHDKATVEVIFRRFVGQDGPNVKNSTSASDSDAVNEYYNGLIGVKMARERKVVDRIVPNTFTGKAAVDWLMDCCTTVDRRETYEIAELFVQHGLMYAALEDKVFTRQNLAASRFQPTKEAIFGVAEKGQRVAGWIKEPLPSIPTEKPSSSKGQPSSREVGSETGNASNGTAATGGRRPTPRDSNNNRLLHIVNDPALRLLFREYLRDTHCEENLAFYIEVREFTKQYDISERNRAFTRLDAVRENLAAAYGAFSVSLSPWGYKLTFRRPLQRFPSTRLTVRA